MEIKTIEKFNDDGVIRYQNSEDNIKNSILRETQSLFNYLFYQKKKNLSKKDKFSILVKSLRMKQKQLDGPVY